MRTCQPCSIVLHCLFLSSSSGTLPFMHACMLRLNNLYLDVLLELAEIINLIEVMGCIYNHVLGKLSKWIYLLQGKKIQGIFQPLNIYGLTAPYAGQVMSLQMLVTISS